MEAAAKSPSPHLSASPVADKAEEEITATPLQEPFAGNVSKRTPLPPDGEAGKRGLLQFDACFEGGDVANSNQYFFSLIPLSMHAGNLGRVDYISEFEYDLFIRPDTCNSK